MRESADEWPVSLTDDVSLWLLQGIEAARAQAAPGLDGANAALAAVGFDALADMAPDLAEVGAAKAVAAVTLLGVGRADEAKRYYMAHVATEAELLAAIRGDALAAGGKAAAQRAAWERTEKRAIEAGLMALKIAVPLLLAAL